MVKALGYASYLAEISSRTYCSQYYYLVFYTCTASNAMKGILEY